MLSFHNFPSYPYQLCQLIHPCHEVFTLSLVPSDNLSIFNEPITNVPKFPLILSSASLSLSTGTYYNPVKFLTCHFYVRRKKKKLHLGSESAVILSACETAWQWQKRAYHHLPLPHYFSLKERGITNFHLTLAMLELLKKRFNAQR